ncbi:MAG: 4-(cytidine 5'-diphospho)-2-C-methyl-D-erythritol kinase [Desulfobacteraceae bacterium]|nr:MAG: 4-(cytidine 5'-diphospho)-2-C-methyl-D-erythritol kinase [Desulfobacteraceae bacterium]
MDIQSPAKINLFLEVTGKRADGYHNLNTLMCCIDLHDAIRLSFEKTGITIHCTHPDVPNDESNLACRAAKLFFDAASCGDGLHIDLEKKIPIGAGLGGGSSNAAAVLKGLNAYYGSPLLHSELMGLGKTIGADVPFFIYRQPAFAAGIGDILTPCPHLEPFPVVLIYPSVPVSTAEVYKKLNLRLTKTKKINTDFLFEQNLGRDAFQFFFNDLEPVASIICPEIMQAKASLLHHNAMTALMTGSGSAVFGLFENDDLAEKAYTAISGQIAGSIDNTRIWQVYRSHLVV